MTSWASKGKKHGIIIIQGNAYYVIRLLHREQIEFYPMTKEDRLWNIVNNNTHMFTSLLDCKLITSTIIWIIWNFIAFWSNRSPMKSYFWTPRMWSKSASCKCNCATTQLLLISCERKKCSIIINIVVQIKNNIRGRNVDVSVFIESYFFPKESPF